MFYVNTVARVISLMFFMSCHVTSIPVNQLDKKIKLRVLTIY